MRHPKNQVDSPEDARRPTDGAARVHCSQEGVKWLEERPKQGRALGDVGQHSHKGCKPHHHAFLRAKKGVSLRTQVA